MTPGESAGIGAAGIGAARLWLQVNGETMQDGNTNQMIFPIAAIVSYVSQFMLLRAGDVARPREWDSSRKPPRYLKAGDSVRLGILSIPLMSGSWISMSVMSGRCN